MKRLSGHDRLRLRRLSGLSICLVIVLALAACNSGGKSASAGSFAGKTLTVAMGPPDSPSEKKFNDELAAAFKQQTGATIKYDYNITDTQTELQTIDAAAVSNSGPDLMKIGDTISAAAYKSGAFQTLDDSDWAKLGGKKAFYPVTMANSGPDASHTITVPIYVDPTMMVYNTKLFAKAHITHPPTTWTEYVEDAQKINDPQHKVYGTDWFPDDTQVYKAMWYFGEDYGGSVFSPDLKKATINTQAWLDAVKFWFSLDTKYHVVPPDSDTNTQAKFASDFANGNIGEEVAATASYEGTYEAGKIGKDFRFAPLPTTPYGKVPSSSDALPTSMDLYEGYIIASYASKPLALEFLKLSDSPKFQKLQFQLEGYMPATVADGNVVKKLDPDLMTPQIAAELGAKGVPYTPAWSTFQTAIGTVTIDAGAYLTKHGSVPDSMFQQLLNSANTTVQGQLK